MPGAAGQDDGLAVERFTPRLDVLPHEQRDLWEQLAPTRDLHFSLYGGTALALRLGHRQSVDFDFFTHEPLVDDSALVRALPILKDARILQRAANTFVYMTQTRVKLSFFGGLGYGRVGEIGITDDDVLNVASLDDLMTTKLAALVQRIEAKDYVDVATMLGAGMDLARGLGGVLTLFGASLPPMEIARTLAWFEGGDLGSLPDEVKAVLVRATQQLDMAKVRPLPVLARTLD